MRIHSAISIWAIAGALFCDCALARQVREEPSASGTLNAALLTRQFLAAHPDLKYRDLGMKAYGSGRKADASLYFQRAAFYGDKPSQGMLAEMFWNGDGVSKDRQQAYIWMDLASERGYALFVEQRERYWPLLSQSEQAGVSAEGARTKAIYGDAAAKPRLARKLRMGLSSATGSHLGSTAGSALTIQVAGRVCNLNCVTAL